MNRREFMTAAGVAGGAGAVSRSAVAADAETDTPTETGESGSGGGGPFTRTVEMTDANVFEPDTIPARPGDTVVWENVGSADHTVTAYEDDIPGDAEYWASGGFDSEGAARDGYPDEGLVGGGETFEHTFETEGTHEYFCIPHEGAGMVGAVEVSGDAPTPEPERGAGGGGRREVDPEHMGVPFQAHFVGLATALMVLVSLVYTFYVLKYGESPNTKGGND